MSVMESEVDLVERAVGYHGSLCPGLAMGIQAARLALSEIGHSTESDRLVAVAETDICAIDAVQALTGCTLGNRNLLLRDYGKNVFTFWRPSDGKAVRIAGRPAWDAAYQALRKKASTETLTPAEEAELASATDAEARRILAVLPAELYSVTPVKAPVPRTSQVDVWITCDGCGEHVMEDRTRRRHGHQLCVPCFESAIAAA